MQINWINSHNLRFQAVLGYLMAAMAVALFAVAGIMAFSQGAEAAGPTYDATLDVGVQVGAMALLLIVNDRSKVFWWSFATPFVLLTVVDFILRFQAQIDDPRLDFFAVLGPVGVAVVLVIDVMRQERSGGTPTTS